MIDFLFISPHLKKIGETYVLPRLCEFSHNKELNIALFNVAGEWDHLKNSDKHIVIDNKFRWVVNLAPDLEKMFPWLNYRIWLSFASISIFFGLLHALNKHSIKACVARMATSSVGLCSFFSTKTKFIASMAGVPLKSAIRSATWPILYKKLDCIVVPCESMKNNISALTKRNENDILVCPNPVVEEDFITKNFLPSIEDEKCDLLFVGRLTNQKGVDTLIKTLALLDNSFFLHIFGDGEDESKLKIYAKKIGVKHKIKFYGRVNNPWKNINDYNIYLMPSRWEGPGHTIIEALSHGIPSIVSNCPYGPEETIDYGKFGEVFEIDDCDDFADKIQKTWKDYSNSLEKASLGQLQTNKYKPSSIYSFWLNLKEE